MGYLRKDWLSGWQAYLVQVTDGLVLSQCFLGLLKPGVKFYNQTNNKGLFDKLRGKYSAIWPNLAEFGQIPLKKEQAL